MGKKHENQNYITSSHVHTSREYVSSRFMLFPTILAKKYKTHMGHRTHELTTQVSSCILYPLCVLYFTNSNCKIYMGRIKTFFSMFSSRFMLFLTFLETYKTHKGYRTHALTTHVISNPHVISFKKNKNALIICIGRAESYYLYYIQLFSRNLH